MTDLTIFLIAFILLHWWAGLIGYGILYIRSLKYGKQDLPKTKDVLFSILVGGWIFFHYTLTTQI